MKTLSKEIAPIIKRGENAKDSFYEVVESISGCTRSEAIKVLNVFLKLKVAKINYASGKVDIKHGAYLEKEPILNALGITFTF